MAKLVRINRKLARVGRKLVTDANGAPCCCGSPVCNTCNDYPDALPPSSCLCPEDGQEQAIACRSRVDQNDQFRPVGHGVIQLAANFDITAAEGSAQEGFGFNLPTQAVQFDRTVTLPTPAVNGNNTACAFATASPTVYTGVTLNYRDHDRGQDRTARVMMLADCVFSARPLAISPADAGHAQWNWPHAARTPQSWTAATARVSVQLFLDGLSKALNLFWFADLNLETGDEQLYTYARFRSFRAGQLVGEMTTAGNQTRQGTCPCLWNETTNLDYTWSDFNGPPAGLRATHNGAVTAGWEWRCLAPCSEGAGDGRLDPSAQAVLDQQTGGCSGCGG